MVSINLSVYSYLTSSTHSLLICTQARTHARTHTCTQAHTHASTHARTHTHTHTQENSHGANQLEHVFVLDVLHPQPLELLPLAAEEALTGVQVGLQDTDLVLGVWGRGERRDNTVSEPKITFIYWLVIMSSHIRFCPDIKLFWLALPKKH